LNATLLKSSLRAAAVAALAALAAGCTDKQMEDWATHGGKELSAKILARMKAKDMAASSPIMARIFKEEGKVEIWKAKSNGRYDLIAMYDICKWSGKLGPKFIEGDRQAPEGFYAVRPAQMNPNSKYHLSFNIGYPNAYDRVHNRTGSNLMVHGACSSQGCYSMNDNQVEEIYALGLEAFKGGQTEFQIEAFPFRMTAANMARYRNDPNIEFWKNLKEGYDAFEVTRVPPKVGVCEKRYVFNRENADGRPLSPAGACPPETALQAMTEYRTYQSAYQTAFDAALKSGDMAAPRASINGLAEAGIVSEWTKKRARGERIPIDPPSMASDGSITVTSRMGRIDSDVGRKQAAKEAAERAAEEKKRAVAEAKAAKAAEKAAAKLAVQPPPPPAAAPEAVAATAPPPPEAGLLGSVKKRFGSLFGG
jgi:murein L,D-transpeptidase YafK